MSGEKFYICERCGELITESENLVDVSYGGQGLCMCDYVDRVWDETYQDFEPVYNRIFRGYTEISEWIYNELKSESNHVLRLRMFRTLPVKYLR